ncbi:PEP/pyruvate-binding domain-containing protein [Verrucomicrobiaceae bacterium 227]
MMKRMLSCACLVGILSGEPEPELWQPDGGKFQISVAANADHYSVLYRSKNLVKWEAIDVDSATSGDLVLRDPVRPRRQGYFRVESVPRSTPGDLDGDGRDDLLELADHHALNAANPLAVYDGDIFLGNQERFDQLSRRDNFPGAQNVKEVKFLIADIRTQPRLHFINVNQHEYHYYFARDVLGIGLSNASFTQQTYFSNSSRNYLAGSLVQHENYIAADGTKGIFTLEFWPTDPVDFEWIDLAYGLIAKNAPFIDRLAYHAPSETQRQIQRANEENFEASFIHTIETEDLFSSTTFQPMNQRSAFGRLVVSTGSETLSARDIVIFRNLPNDLTYVSGIITEVPQTPLSHVNLKAQQNNTPNAYIADAATHAGIAPFIGQNVSYEVTAEGFEIRAATQSEVDVYFESIRPASPSFPDRDLSETKILPLSEVTFGKSNAFGGKATNVAELGRLFPGVAPDGFAIPFYFYDEFMKHNGFYAEAATMLNDSSFQNDPAIREAMLKAFRTRIKNESTLPSWMHDALTTLQGSFPAEVTPRLRSSANAEDSTSFNGAGLYDSYTHKADEGHITKSVLQVWASLWNYRAFEEREFYRIDHLSSAMGILVHPNEKNEIANGVAVARNIFDPNWEGYYFNVQAGEDLVTNPEENSIPEELLVADLLGATRYEIQYIRYSNQVPEGETVLRQAQVLALVDRLRILNQHFRSLYGELGNSDFAMEIEFKITESGAIQIKQARPYVY